MKELTVEIKPITPLWTGNENRKSIELRETGIIGSLRWWYGALIRGLEGLPVTQQIQNAKGVITVMPANYSAAQGGRGSSG